MHRHPRRGGSRVTAIAAAVLALALAGGAGASDMPRWQGGGHLVVATSQGSESGDFGTGLGLEPFAVWRIDPAGVLGLRLQGGMIDFGSSTRSVALSGAGPSVLAFCHGDGAAAGKAIADCFGRRGIRAAAMPLAVDATGLEIEENKTTMSGE